LPELRLEKQARHPALQRLSSRFDTVVISITVIAIARSLQFIKTSRLKFMLALASFG
jgi:hypothetical protein